MRTLLLIACLGMAGCAQSVALPVETKVTKPIPTHPRLEPGTRGVIVGLPFVPIQKYGSQPDWRETFKGMPHYHPDFTDDDNERSNPMIAAGESVMVLTDSENGPEENANRLIYVKVLTGPYSTEGYMGKYLIEWRYFKSTPLD